MIDLKFKEEVNHYSNEINKVSPAVRALIPTISNARSFKTITFGSSPRAPWSATAGQQLLAEAQDGQSPSLSAIQTCLLSPSGDLEQSQVNPKRHRLVFFFLFLIWGGMEERTLLHGK